jgi:hypothetical protein
MFFPKQLAASSNVRRQIPVQKAENPSEEADIADRLQKWVWLGKSPSQMISLTWNTFPGEGTVQWFRAARSIATDKGGEGWATLLFLQPIANRLGQGWHVVQRRRLR